MASSDYISREAAEKVFSQPVTMSMCLTLEECKMKNAQRQIDLFVIRGLPAADVRPVVRGKWKLGGYGQISDATVKWYDQFLQGGFFYCSACKERTSVKTNFCPNCGARMEES